MQMTRTAQIRALIARTTEGPWVLNKHPTSSSIGNIDTLTSYGTGDIATTWNDNNHLANADLIARSRQLVPELLDLLEGMGEALRKIAKRPDLPNPERDADWKNCVKWNAHEAKEQLTKFDAWNGV